MICSLYRTLITGADLAKWVGDTTNLTGLWTTQAAKLKIAINQYCWDESYGAFKDNATSTSLHPQDANSMAILFSVVDSDSARASSISSQLLVNWTPIGAETPELPGNISPFISSFEIQAHFTIGQTARALELIRRSWGWYINNPLGSGSTVIEGYLTDGSFGYRSTRGYSGPSYVSHSHGWSSGPTSALTNYVLGLSVTSPVGETWKLAPQFGDLNQVEGGFMTTLGKFQASWALWRGGYTISFQAPLGTVGELVIPVLVAGEMPKITMDDVIVPQSSKIRRQHRLHKREAVLSGNSVSFSVTGGNHTVTVG